jgi:Flp pilus assembly protein TadD
VTDAKALRDQALDLLRRAKNPEAMDAASKALEADPTDAMPYLVLGSALQDAGRWREAARAYQLCVKTAKHGMVDECRAMIRRR